MANKYVQFLNPVLGVHVVDPHSVVEASHDQLLPHDVSAVHRDLVSAHLVLVPKQN